MLKTHEITPKMFKGAQTVLRAPFAFLTMQKLEDCCIQWKFVGKTGVIESFDWTRKANENSRKQVIFEVADRLVTYGDPYASYAGLSVNDTTWTQDNEIIAKMEPTTIPGTDAGSVYTIIAATSAGSVSYCHGNLTTGHPRIRIVKYDTAVGWPSTTVNPTTKQQFATVTDKHQSYTGKDPEENKKVIAHGLENLFRLANIGI